MPRRRHIWSSGWTKNSEERDRREPINATRGDKARVRTKAVKLRTTFASRRHTLNERARRGDRSSKPRQRRRKLKSQTRPNACETATSRQTNCRPSQHSPFLPLKRLMRTLPLKDNQGRRRQLGDQTSPSSDPPLRAQGSRSSSSTAEWGVLGD